ncbi:transposable element Tcb2 transposase [Trichonephila clavipes]|nr:transposable element Tcb2 transposase [Trichonephila clavipes]
MGLQFLFMDDNAPCHRTVAAEQLLENACSSYLTTSNDFGLFRLALQDEWAAMPQQLIDTLILSMGRRCETCLAVRRDHIPTKDRMFLAGHASQGCFGLQSHCAPCYFFNQASFYPSDFSFRTVVPTRRRNMYTARATIDLLKDTFGDRLISRFGPVNWPPRSCDLTPLDYFLGGLCKKSLVYADKPQTLDHLKDNIHRVFADIRPQMLESHRKLDVQIRLHPSQPWQSYARNHI